MAWALPKTSEHVDKTALCALEDPPRWLVSESSGETLDVEGNPSEMRAPATAVEILIDKRHSKQWLMRSEVESVKSLDAICILAEQDGRMAQTKSHTLRNVALPGTIKVAARTEVMG